MTLKLVRRSVWMACGLAVCCGSAAVAQGVEFGVKGGVNLSSVTFSGGTSEPSRDLRIAGVFGGFVTLPINSWLELQPEGLYAMKGVKLTTNDIKSTLALDYVEVPVLAKITRRGAGRHFYVAGGPSFGLRVRARTRVDFGTATEDIDVSDNVERFDLGIAVGGGVELTPRLVIDGRYTFGLKDIDKDKTDAVKMKNQAISITAGYRF